MVISNSTTQLLVSQIVGRKEVEEGLVFVAGGHIGEKYDVIVDNISKPSRVIGVCGVPGRVMDKHDETAKKKMLEARAFLSKNLCRPA